MATNSNKTQAIYYGGYFAKNQIRGCHATGIALAGYIAYKHNRLKEILGWLILWEIFNKELPTSSSFLALGLHLFAPKD